MRLCRSSITLIGILLCVCALAGCAATGSTNEEEDARLVHIGEGWAQSSVNAAIFRKNSVVSHGDTQYAAYYDAEGRVMLAKRRHRAGDWEVHATQYMGNVRDAHNAISIGVDGTGILHVSWDHHGQPLNFARGTAPGSLELTDPQPMTGLNEDNVTYPQFYHTPGGDLLFMYRDGSSGSGNVMLNRFDVATEEWTVVQHPLIDGEAERNPYPDHLAVDRNGGIHLSWVWRESPDVASNHDLSYAHAPDGGVTWTSSSGETYELPITIDNAEVARRIPQGSELINQSSLAVDSQGRPHIATYWRPEGSDIPQYHLVWLDGSEWQTREISRRTTPFRLSGGGTKRIPISRPLVLIDDEDAVYVVFRDEELGNGVSVAVSSDTDRRNWSVLSLLEEDLGAWEPSHDPVMWEREGALHLFIQHVGQGDAETLEDIPPQPVSILEWKP